MNTEALLQQTIQLLDPAFPEQAKILRSELGKLSDTRPRLGVLGEFKSGKSTLINALFLRDEVLFTDALEATCVPTEIIHSASKRLTLVSFRKAAEIRNVEGEEIVIPGEGEGTPSIVESPDTQKIQAETSAPTPEGRANKALKMARATLEWPCEPLKAISLYDTPGLNSPNTAVVNSTFQLLSKLDAAIIVSASAQLSEHDLEFLGSQVAKNGIIKVMVVINPRESLNELGEKDWKESVEAQLRNLGISGMPVEVLNAKEALALTTKNGVAEALTTERLAKFEKTLLQFATTAPVIGRMLRPLNILDYEVGNALLRIRVETEMANKSVEEAARIRKEAQNKRDAASYDAERTYIIADDKIDALTEKAAASFGSQMSQFGGDFRKRFPMLGNKEDILEAEKVIRAELQGKLLAANSQFQLNIDKELKSIFKDKVAPLLDHLKKGLYVDIEGFSLPAEGDIIDNMDMETVLLVFMSALGPYGQIAAAVLVFLDNIIPGLLGSIAGQFVNLLRMLFGGENISAKVHKAVQSGAEKLAEEFQKSLRKAGIELKAQFRAAVEDQINQLARPVTDVPEAHDPARIVKLQAMEKQLLSTLENARKLKREISNEPQS